MLASCWSYPPASCLVTIIGSAQCRVLALITALYVKLIENEEVGGDAALQWCYAGLICGPMALFLSFLFFVCINDG